MRHTAGGGRPLSDSRASLEEGPPWRFPGLPKLSENLPFPLGTPSVSIQIQREGQTHLVWFLNTSNICIHYPKNMEKPVMPTTQRESLLFCYMLLYIFQILLYIIPNLLLHISPGFFPYVHVFKYILSRPGMVAHACNPSYLEAEAGELLESGRRRLQ